MIIDRLDFGLIPGAKTSLVYLDLDVDYEMALEKPHSVNSFSTAKLHAAGVVIEGSGWLLLLSLLPLVLI